MIDFYSALRTTIQLGEYALADLEDRIDTLWVEGRITADVLRNCRSTRIWHPAND